MAQRTDQVEEPLDDREARVERQRFVLANVRQYPDPALRMRAREVEELDGALAELVERMIHVMKTANGVGLAAPQVGVLQRVLVHQANEETGPVALVNARVVASSDETDVMEEGCLSLGAAGVNVPVVRPLSVTVEALSPSGEELRFDAEGLEARVIQHEIDHLDGILIIDRTTPDERREALAQLRPRPVLGRIA